MNSLAQYISETLTAKFDIPAEFVDASTSYEALELDSLVLVELAVILSREYGVEITDDEIKDAQTIENTARLLLQKGLGAAV